MTTIRDPGWVSHNNLPQKKHFNSIKLEPVLSGGLHLHSPRPIIQSSDSQPGFRQYLQFLVLYTCLTSFGWRQMSSSKGAANKKRLGNTDPEFTYISIFSPTLAQVQIEIMKAVTKKLTTPSESAFVQGFISRPDMRSLSINLEESYCTGTGCNCMFLDCFALRWPHPGSRTYPCIWAVRLDIQGRSGVILCAIEWG